MKTLVTGGSGFLGTYVRQFFGADDMSRRSGHDILNMQDAAMVRDYDVVVLGGGPAGCGSARPS